MDNVNLAWDTSFDVDISAYDTADEDDSYLHLRQLSESVYSNVFDDEENDELNEAFDQNKLDLQLKSPTIEHNRVYNLDNNLPVSSTPKKKTNSKVKQPKSPTKKSSRIANLKRKAEQLARKISPNSTANGSPGKGKKIKR